jgi:hypothetical protein
MTHYCGLYTFGGKITLTHVSIDLTQVSVPTENGLQQLSTFIHALKGPALTRPLMTLGDQHFQFMPTQVQQATHK